MRKIADGGTVKHDWFISRLVALRAGLLEESEQQRLEQHLRECEHCTRLHASLGSVTTGDVQGHIPADLLVRWVSDPAQIQGLERQLIEHHLERCEECRADRELLESSRERAGTLRHGEPRGSRVLPWALGGWAALATAASLLLWVNPGLFHRGTPAALDDRGKGLSAHRSNGPAPSGSGSSGVARLDAVPALELNGVTRGVDTSDNVLPIRASTTRVVLSFLPPEAPAGGSLQGEVTTPGCANLRSPVWHERELPSATLLLEQGGTPLAAGPYDLRVFALDASGAVRETLQLHFVLRADDR